MCQSDELFAAAAVAGVGSRSTYANMAVAHDSVYVNDADYDSLSYSNTIPGLCFSHTWRPVLSNCSDDDDDGDDDGDGDDEEEEEGGKTTLIILAFPRPSDDSDEYDDGCLFCFYLTEHITLALWW